MEIAHPYLIFLGDVPDALAAKTGLGIVDWRREWCLGQLRLAGCAADAGLPDMTIAEAKAAGAETLVIGAVNRGGILPDHWVGSIVAALHGGLDVASGLHMRLADDPEIRAAAERTGRKLHDVRHSRDVFATGSGLKRTGKRLLTVGTDCSVGKKYTALTLERDMRRRGFEADFRATGQTGVFISGRGVAIDAVAADFISGAVEWLSPDAVDDHWDLIEGQGSLFHPSFAGVSLGLLHGAQADAFVVCHEPTRTSMRGVANALPSIVDVIDLTIACGRLTNPAIQCVGLAVNTEKLSDEDADLYCQQLGTQHGLPACDPVRHGTGAIIDRISAIWGAPS